MGFDIREKAVLSGWMSTTVQFALVSSGRDEVTEDEVLASVREATNVLPNPAAMREVAVALLSKAQDLLGPEREDHVQEEIEPGHLTNVMQWSLMTAAAVFVGKGKPFDHEKLEAVVEHKIIAGIQGNRQRPTRCDLDTVVRKTISWGLGELGVVPVGG